MTDVWDWYTEKEWKEIQEKWRKQEDEDNLPENKRKREIKEAKEHIEYWQKQLSQLECASKPGRN